MESVLGPGAVTFEVLRSRLIQLVRLRVHNGEFTERGLARMLGISQSQTHNVLKGVRGLQMQLADRMLTKLGLNPVDLLTEYELERALRHKIQELDAGMPHSELLTDSSMEVDLEAMLAVKMPAASSDLRIRPTDIKTG